MLNILRNDHNQIKKVVCLKFRLHLINHQYLSGWFYFDNPTLRLQKTVRLVGINISVLNWNKVQCLWLLICKPPVEINTRFCCIRNGLNSRKVGLFEVLVFIAAAADGRTVRSRWFNFFMKSVQMSIFYFGIFGDLFLLANIFVVFLVWPLLFQSTLVTLKKKEGKANRN